MPQYAHPEMVVETAWVAEYGKDVGIRLIEVDVDIAAYDQDHIPGAISWNWATQLCDTVRRDILPKHAFERLMANSGISNDTTVVLYGDHNNWFAAWALWQMKMYGHQDARLMNGGRRKWILEGRELTDAVPAVTKAATYRGLEPDMSLRALLPKVRRVLETNSHALVDVRSPDEFTGRILSPPGLPETCQRGGHIPGAKNIPWGMVCNEDGSFKSADELAALYQSKGVTVDKPTMTYCRIGERSSHTWFVLKYLLGCRDVTNYDGSWTEWGNMVRAPIEYGPETATGKAA